MKELKQRSNPSGKNKPSKRKPTRSKSTGDWKPRCNIIPLPALSLKAEESRTKQRKDSASDTAKMLADWRARPIPVSRAADGSFFLLFPTGLCLLLNTALSLEKRSRSNRG